MSRSREHKARNYLQTTKPPDEVISDATWSDPHLCPVCDEKAQRPVAEILQEKLGAYDDVDIATKEIKSLWESAAWPNRLRSLETTLDIASKGKTWQPLNAVLASGLGNNGHASLITDTFRSLEKLRVQAIETTSAEIKQLEKLVPPSIAAVTKQIAEAKALNREMKLYETEKKTWSFATLKLLRRTEWQSFIVMMSEQFGAAEAELSETRRAAIASDYQAMNKSITRNPDVVPILERPTSTERVLLKLDHFYGLGDVSANTLLQESYSNALAMSVFLASAMKSNTPARFIILDDVTSSFDSGHQFNLMELLRNEIGVPGNANGPQIVVLTHDSLLEKYLDKVQTTNTWRHQKLLGRPPNGPVLTEQYDVQRVRTRAANYLAAGQADAAKPWIRQYLESVLGRVIKKANIPVPIDYAMSDSRKQVQHSLDAIKNALELHQQAGRLILTAMQTTNASQTLVPALLGNWCAHYDTATYAGLTPHVLMGVIDDVDALADCFQYECTCGTDPRFRFYRSLANRGCTCTP